MFKGIKREPNSFSYRSRFYDSAKEEREKRKRGVKLELEDDIKTERTISFSRGDRDDWIKQSYKKQAFNSNIVIIVVLIILCFISLAAIKYLDTIHV